MLIYKRSFAHINYQSHGKKNNYIKKLGSKDQNPYA